MTEPEVLQKVHRFLLEGRLPSDAARGASGAETSPTADLSRLYTDTHGTLVDLVDRMVRPDLVGQSAYGWIQVVCKRILSSTSSTTSNG